MNEDALVMKLSLEQALASLSPDTRDLVLIYYQLDHPNDYDGAWPPTYASVGAYVGMRYTGEPIPEGAVRYRVEMALKKCKKII